MFDPQILRVPNMVKRPAPPMRFLIISRAGDSREEIPAPSPAIVRELLATLKARHPDAQIDIWRRAEPSEFEPEPQSAPSRPQPSARVLEAGDRLLTTHEAGLLLDSDSSSIVKWVKEGRLKVSFTPGGHRRVRYSELCRFAETFQMDIRPLSSLEETKQ